VLNILLSLALFSVMGHVGVAFAGNDRRDHAGVPAVAGTVRRGLIDPVVIRGVLCQGGAATAIMVVL
jgi:hypothetical protein